MADNYAKLWLQKRLNQNSIQRANEAIQATGRALPCRVTAVSGAIVTVAFELDSSPWTLPQITIPKAESNWIRMPTQVGDLGVTLPADAYLSGISGLGGGIAKLRMRPGNLSALIFVPVSNATSPPVNQNMAQIQGPAGAIIRTSDGASTITVNETSITLTAGGKTFSISASGITIDGIAFETHYHTGVQTGSGNTGGPL
jgi:GpV-like protein with Apex motif